MAANTVLQTFKLNYIQIYLLELMLLMRLYLLDTVSLLCPTQAIPA
jgi:hypothetical protein